MKALVHPLVQVILALVLGTSLCACTSTQTAAPDPQATHDVFGRPTRIEPTWSNAQRNELRIPTQAGPDAWSIILTASDDPAKAQALLEQVRTHGQLPDAFIMERNGRQVIAVGSYDSLSQVARIELDRVRSLVIDGVRPYEHAFLAPPSGELSRGSIPEYDLRNARAQYGDDAVYTLQIAVYGREDNKEPTEQERAQFRKAAEEAAINLRQSGELAFYYHGPSRSMVTVGIFSEEDHHLERGVAVESARLKLARDRHPLNLLNGRTIIEKARTSSGGTVEREQPSFLVAIPKS
ncbi:MAG: hypothetical protein D6695_09265 [Planctomycetota bacterium]|nr:MAG: hypothetical protein D6695_09265 [Planctomycetota bacterium]